MESLAARLAALGGDRRLRFAVALICFAVVTALTALIAHPKMFTGFTGYDDEGYMLTAIKSFVNHGHLYDDVFTQYGPFYYDLWGGFFSLFGIAVTNDAGRTVVTVLWVLASLVFGLSILRLTGSVLLGLGTQVLTFAVLGVLTIEPMHPISTIALMLAVILAISTFVGEGRSRWAIGLLGAVVAALVLTKINIGAFALVSLALVCAVSYQQLWGRRWPRIAIEAIFLAVPIVLLSGKFGEDWARQYSVHVFAAALAVVIALRATEPARREGGELRWLIGGFVGLAVLACLGVIATGTSVHGLIEGVIRQPLRQADAFTIPMRLSQREYAFDLLAVATALLYWYAGRRGTTPRPAWLVFGSLFAIVVGVVMALSMLGDLAFFDDTNLLGYQLSMLPFAWIGLAVSPVGGRPKYYFARMLLPALAALQGLHGYPVAGAQVYLSVLLLVPVGALSVANGMRGLALVSADQDYRLVLGGLGAVGAIVLTLFIGINYLKDPLHESRGIYHGAYALDLPGARDIHLPDKKEKATFEDVARAMDENCESTQMLPGLDSFYLWTGQEPPSLTATGWETLFSDELQERVIADIAPIEGLCLLRNKEHAAGWGEREGPLVTYLEHGFTLIGKWDEYELLRREGPAPASS